MQDLEAFKNVSLNVIVVKWTALVVSSLQLYVDTMQIVKEEGLLSYFGTLVFTVYNSYLGRKKIMDKKIFGLGNVQCPLCMLGLRRKFLKICI